MGKTVSIVILIILLLLSLAAIGYGVLKILDMNDEIDAMKVEIDALKGDKLELEKALDQALKDLSFAQDLEAVYATEKGVIYEQIQAISAEIQALYSADQLKLEEEQEYNEASLLAAKFVESFTAAGLKNGEAVQGKNEDSNVITITYTKLTETIAIEISIEDESLVVTIGEWISEL